MKNLIFATGGMFLLIFAQTAFACDYPARIEIPNGATASKEDMLAGVKQVEEFKLQMATYLDCIMDQEKAARAAIDDLQPEVEQQREDMLTKKHNAAVEAEEKLVAQFNVEIRAYKTANE